MTDRRREVRIGVACALIVLTIWTAFILVSRAGMRGTLTPFDLAALRFGFAATVLFPVFLRRGMGALNFGQFAAIGSIAGIGYALFAYSGFVFAPASHGAVLLLPKAAERLSVQVLKRRGPVLADPMLLDLPQPVTAIRLKSRAPQAPEERSLATIHARQPGERRTALLN